MTSILTPAARRIALPCLAAGALAFGLGLGPIAALATPGDELVADAPTLVVEAPALEETPVVVDALDGYQLPTLDAPPASAPVATTSGPSAEFTATTGRLVGVVTDLDGTPLPDTTVVVYDGNGVLAGATTTGADGSYATDELAPGDYRIMFVAERHVVEFWEDVVDPGLATPIAVAAGADTTASAALTPFPKISVEVRYTDGTVAEDYRVYVHEAISNDVEAWTSIDPGGVALLTVAPGDYVVQILDDSSTYVGWYDGDQGLGASPLTFEAVAGQSPYLIVIEIPLPGQEPETPENPEEPGDGIEECVDEEGLPSECGELPEYPEHTDENETEETETEETQLDTLALTGASVTPAAVGTAAAIALTGVVLLAARKTRRTSR